MRILITGCSGQLGRALLLNKPLSIGGTPIEILVTTRDGADKSIPLDLQDLPACRDIVRDTRPDWIINAAAYTNVEQAESNIEIAELVNRDAPCAMAEAAQRVNATFLQISTDFVFDGKATIPYTTNDTINPINIYGQTKADAETALKTICPDDKICILRTSWLYGPSGKNFCRSILKNLATKNEINVVSDQYGSPTSTLGLSRTCWAVITKGLSGIHHWCDQGVTSWYEFAQEINNLGETVGLLNDDAYIKPIPSSDYPGSVSRPKYSPLDCTTTSNLLGLHPQPWQQSLHQVLLMIKNSG